jgi:ribulose-phosphate 3-epimerase
MGENELRGPLVAPSMLSSDFGRLAEEAARMEAAGADWLHLDVMDGHFVPNLTIGMPVVAALRRATGLLLDCHLMIAAPERYAERFVEAGADLVCFHVEAAADSAALARRIRAAGARAGIALKPATPAAAVLPLLAEVELVLVMTVEPGFGGQRFMTGMMPKLEALAAAAAAQRGERGGRELWLQVDGGIDAGTAPVAAAAGADVFVAGSAIFRAVDAAQAIAAIREGARAARR